MTAYSIPDFTAAVGASAGLLAYAVRSPRSALLAPSVYRGSQTRPAIALTFDDGPSESTPELLKILHRYGASATFFQCGANVRRLSDIAREVAAAGHEIGNHTDTHPALYLKSSGFIYRELAAAGESIERVTGVRPRLFRRPLVRTPRCAAQAWSDGRNVDHARAGLEMAVRSRGAPHPGRRSKRGYLLLARRPPAGVTAGYSGDPGGAARSSAKIDRTRFPFRKGDRNPMSNEELTERVRRIIATAQHLPEEKVTADSTFAELNIDSLDGINILFAVESEFNINIPDEAARSIRSVRDVIDGIAKLLAEGTHA